MPIRFIAFLTLLIRNTEGKINVKLSIEYVSKHPVYFIKKQIKQIIEWSINKHLYCLGEPQDKRSRPAEVEFLGLLNAEGRNTEDGQENKRVHKPLSYYQSCNTFSNDALGRNCSI